ncbi:MAG TPA: Na+/H+ antiporter NhaA [Acidimicrobiales bacterium]
MPPTGTRLQRILQSDVAAAWILVAAVAVALVWANGSWAHTYASTWLHPAHAGGRAFDGFTTWRDWVNGGLMAVFFLVVGLEIGRERRHGDLADVRTAAVPVAGALGGMAGAGLVYAAVAHGGPGSSGWGIPMATDIAFALGALALLGRRVPSGLRVFLLTLAVADDIASVVVLAVFYSSRSRPLPLVAAVAVVVALVVLRRLTRTSTALVVVGGLVLWVLLAAGGVEPALAGVVAGLLVPGRSVAGGPDPAERLERRVAPWSAFVVLPLFAVANAGITFHAGMLAGPGAAAVFWGVGLARVAGKLGGITLACLAVVRAGLGRLPDGVRWRHLAGGAAVAGIGFTVPLLIAELAFVHRPHLVAAAELGLFAGSAAAFAVGATVLLWSGSAGPSVAPAPAGGGDAGGGPEEPPIPW